MVLQHIDRTVFCPRSRTASLLQTPRAGERDRRSVPAPVYPGFGISGSINTGVQSTRSRGKVWRHKWHATLPSPFLNWLRPQRRTLHSQPMTLPKISSHNLPLNSDRLVCPPDLRTFPYNDHPLDSTLQCPPTLQRATKFLTHQSSLRTS